MLGIREMNNFINIYFSHEKINEFVNSSKFDYDKLYFSYSSSTLFINKCFWFASESESRLINQSATYLKPVSTLDISQIFSNDKTIINQMKHIYAICVGLFTDKDVDYAFKNDYVVKNVLDFIIQYNLILLKMI
jgi:hypothetical protein